MARGFFISLFLAVSVFSNVLETEARPRSAGASFSFNGSGIVYNHNVGKQSFLEVSAVLDYPLVILSETHSPGIKARCIYNFCLGNPSSDLVWFAGPGLAAGYAHDSGTGLMNGPFKYGIIAGICANFGFEYSFDVPVSISLCISPVLASHFTSANNVVGMHLFTSGLLFSLTPQLNICYAF